MINTRPLLADRLPATPVTRKMREQVEYLAQQEGCSMADVQRAAIEFFLSSYGTCNIEMSTENTHTVLQNIESKGSK